MSEFRRRLMFANKDVSYVADGLVFHLDAINTGSVNGYWVDLISGIRFQFNNNVVKDNGYVRFTGNGATQGSSQFYNINLFVGSVEACFQIDEEKSGTCIIMWPGRINTMAFNLNTGSKTIAFGTSNSNSAMNAFTAISSLGYDKTSISLNKNTIVVDGEEFENPTPYHWNWAVSDNKASLGNRFGGYMNTSAYFRGKLYSVRVYDRLLSVSEMKNNQKVDNERFNLGLNI